MSERPGRREQVRREQQVFSITTAAESHSDDLWSREKRYAISMSIRVLCFVGAVIVDGWIRWVLVVGAVFLPYVAVVMANAGVRRRGKGMDAFDPEVMGQLEAKRDRTDEA